MKVLMGFLLGLGTAWAALAIWQRVPEFPDIDENEQDADIWEPRRGDRRPQFDEGWITMPDPYAFPPTSPYQP